MSVINLKKLAGMLNLSPGTVSKALRDSHEISDATKEKVIKLAKELHYQPNVFASSLRKSKSKTIAVVVPKLTNNFFVLAISGIQEAAQSKGYHVLIYVTNEQEQKEIDIIRLLQNGRVDGILISLSHNTQNVNHLKELQEQGMPIVFFDRVLNKFGASTITTTDYQSAYEATAHLISKGCKKIGHTVFSDLHSIGARRMEGCLHAIRDKNMKYDEHFFVSCTDDKKHNYTLIKKLLKAEDRPDGIFASIESHAILIYEVCRELKINMPEQLKLVTFSNLVTGDLLAPSLSRIEQPAFEMGEKAGLLLFKAIEKPKTYQPEHIVVGAKLIPRDSSGG